MVRLQEALQTLGYDVGQVDGEFGYLTRDALCQFQREHRLRVDGMAGQEVHAMLFRPELSAMRRIHIVTAQESLIDIARRYGVTVEYLRRSNRLPLRRPLYEGQRLVIRSRWVIGGVKALVDPRETEFVLRRSGRHLSALGGLQFRMDAEGKIEADWNPDVIACCREQHVEPLAVVHTWDSAGQPDDALHKVLRSRGLRLRAMKRWLELGQHEGIGGVLLDLGGLRFGDGSRFVRLIGELGEQLRRHGRRLIVGVPAMKPGVRGMIAAADIDWARLERSVDGVLLQTHRRTEWDEGVPTVAHLQHSVQQFCRHIPHWKAMLGIGLGAREYSKPTGEIRDLSYQRAVAMAHLRGTRPSWDEARGRLKGTYLTDEAEERTLWLENARSMEVSLRLVERHNLQGLFLWPLGDEDVRTWQIVPHWIKAWRHEGNDTSI